MAKAKKKKTTAKKATAKKSKTSKATKTKATKTTAKKSTAKKAKAKKPTASRATSAKVTKKKRTAAKAPKAKSAESGGAIWDMPVIGSQAPDIQLSVSADDTVALSDFQGSYNVVLYFYPKDDTPGCTKQACAFQADIARYSGTDTVVIGVSPDPHKRHDKFKQKYGLDFALAADEGAVAARRYGVWVEKNLYGRKYMGIQRATFLINKLGRIVAIWPAVKVEGHSTEVLAALAGL